MGRNHLESGRKGRDGKGAGPAPTGGRQKLWCSCGGFLLIGVKPGPQTVLPDTEHQCCAQLPTKQPGVKGRRVLSSRERWTPLETKPLFF